MGRHPELVKILIRACLEPLLVQIGSVLTIADGTQLYLGNCLLGFGSCDDRLRGLAQGGVMLLMDRRIAIG